MTPEVPRRARDPASSESSGLSRDCERQCDDAPGVCPQAPWSTTVPAYMFLWLTWIGAAYGVKIRAHLNFSEVRNVLPRNFQFVLMQIDNLLFLALATIVIFYATDLLTIQWDNGSVVPGTDTIPQWWFYLATPVGWSLLCLRVVQNMIEDVIAIRSGGPLKVQGAMMGE